MFLLKQLRVEARVYEILKIQRVKVEAFKKNLKFTKEMDQAVKELIVKVLYKKKKFQTDLLFFVICAKYN